MTTIAILAAMLAAQTATSVPGPDVVITEEKQVAFEALAEGDDERALADLEARVLEDPEDPALLINLGAAYARLGKAERAAAAYQAAMDSRTRYQLELADGRWVDSRRAARMALERLGTSTALAAR